MRRFPRVLAACLLVLSLLPCQAGLLLKKDDVFAICGDSITNQHQYSAFIEDYLLMCQPVPGLRVAQFGWSAERADGFARRLANDVLPFRPTVVSICYGMNDGFYKPITPETANAFRENETQVITLFKKGGVRTGVIASPGAVDDFYRKDKPGYNDTLADLRDIAKEVAAKEGFAFADLHSLMAQTMKSAKAAYGDDYLFSGADGVHPSPPGHLAMAYGIPKALGCDGAIGTLTVDLASTKASASEGQQVLSFANGKLEVESSRYPFCFVNGGAKSNPKKSVEGILPHLAFNQDLNRYLLVVTGLNGASAKITWGTESKVFSKADLEKGINLAAEFPANPFCESFFKVHAAVRAQQDAEGDEMKKIMNPLLREADKAKVEQVAKDTVAASQKRFEAVRALVVPVKHTIRIEAQP